MAYFNENPFQETYLHYCHYIAIIKHVPISFSSSSKSFVGYILIVSFRKGQITDIFLWIYYSLEKTRLTYAGYHNTIKKQQENVLAYLLT